MQLTPDMKRAIEGVREQFEQNVDFSESMQSINMPVEDKSIEHSPAENPFDNKSKAQNISYVRNFGEIVRTAPQNNKEAELLLKAQITLSPEEFQRCVTNNVSASEVQIAVNNSIIANEINELQLKQQYEKEKFEQEQEQEQQANDVAPDEAMQLGDEYGVMDEIAKTLSEATIVDGADSEISAPDTPEIEREDNGIER